MAKTTPDHPPVSFVVDQISIAISNYMTELVAKTEKGELTHQEYLQAQFPMGADDLLKKAGVNAHDLWLGKKSNHNLIAQPITGGQPDVG
jgi:hypothetical protein